MAKHSVGNGKTVSPILTDGSYKKYQLRLAFFICAIKNLLGADSCENRKPEYNFLSTKNFEAGSRADFCDDKNSTCDRPSLMAHKQFTFSKIVVLFYADRLGVFDS